MPSSSGSSSDPRETIEIQPLPDEVVVMDVDGSLKRLGGDRNILVELAKMFAEDSPGLIAGIEAGIEASRFADAGRGAHSLRGLAANFGAARLMLRLRQLEALAAQGRRDESLILVSEIRAEKRQLDEALDAYCR